MDTLAQSAGGPRQGLLAFLDHGISSPRHSARNDVQSVGHPLAFQPLSVSQLASEAAVGSGHERGLSFDLHWPILLNTPSIPMG